MSNDRLEDITDDWSSIYFEKNEETDIDDEEETDVEEKISSSKEKTDDEEDIDDEYQEYVKNQVDTGSINSFNKERVSDLTGQIVVNYVDNDTFCNAVISWNDACKLAKDNNKSTPPMPNIIGEQILKMVDGLSRRYNFRNYTYIDEMRDDAIYMAIRAVKNYDPAKSNNNNAFGYFNFVMWRAMTTRIKLEKKQNDIKMSMLKDPMYLGYTAETSDDDFVNKDKIISFYDN